MRRVASTLIWLAAGSALLVGPVPAAHAQEPLLAVIVAASRGDQPSDDEIAQMFKRRKLFWRDGARVVPVNLPPDHPLRLRLQRYLLRQTADQQQEYWNEQYFHGVLPPHVLGSEEAMLRFVAGTSAAIGYLPACIADARVRAVLWIDADGALQKPDAAPACPGTP
ncbi:hypothetical protein SAMN04488068_2226 [Hydrocarboniphaga daqingensis]|uniref:Uncharacterized protein n=1 Tax=Hydrocarboniphaga daqingensis TaxID=490188 RepID=A0A1M5PPP8_9GAMM|nr:hypothetical protein [Hydrocarboniphaga daqingensis]SHH03539.1 hypothetical protein SAMN04488068_2226 [Hydrocarboniphaga daqingensis]